ncbi:NAD(P)H-binding protein [Actinomadura barringtoniae]|uniref:NAD(P)H-binding protein n=1 Tax=Actinomadura barringtoniae TaxID=1427535 RepID=A0A939T2U2_9ACTN|nr:NAD(P)H-binding protein [Actinomadura barringtoniae]MBO2445734.1 NAD(P)H-binding protein [Actinomadura barringtoniae]
MSIVVTGATGQLGRLVIDELLERVPADQVVAVVRNAAKATDLAERGVELRIADYTAPETLDGVFQAGDRVLLISSNAMEENTAQHAAVVDAAVKANVALLAYTSVLGGAAATFRIAAHHAATEELILASGLPHVFLRNGWYNENYSGNIGFVLKSGIVMGSAGEGRIASASRADYAAAAAAVLTGEGEDGRSVYELSGDEAWTLADLAAEVSRQTGREIAYRDLTAARYSQIMADAGVPVRDAESVADADLGIARGELAAVTGDLRRLIGRPTTTIADSIAAALKN